MKTLLVARRFRWGIVALAVFLNISVLLVAGAVTWQVANRQTRLTSDLAQEGQLLVAFVGLILTSVLAWVTAVYAILTRGILKSQLSLTASAEEQVEVANQAMAISEAARAAAIMPWLTSQPASAIHAAIELQINGQTRTSDTGVLLWPDASGDLVCAVALSNVGNGLAVIAPGSVRLLPSVRCPQPEATVLGRAPEPVVRVGGVATLLFQLKKTSAAWSGLTLEDFTGQSAGGGTNGDFRVEAAYSDATGGQPTRVELCMFGQFTLAGTQAPLDWIVGRARYFHRDETTPFVETEGGRPTWT